MSLEDVAAHVLRRLVGALVELPDRIQIQTTARSRVMIILKVDIVDYGKVIGKGGATVRALKTIMKALGHAVDEDVRLVVENSDGVDPETRPKFEEAKDWDSTPLHAVVCDVCYGMFTKSPLIGKPVDVGTTTTIDIQVAEPIDQKLLQMEPDRNCPSVSEAFETIFHAIGKAMGRSEVIVDVYAKS